MFEFCAGTPQSAVWSWTQDVPELRTSEPDLISLTASCADGHTLPLDASTAGWPLASALLGTESSPERSTTVDLARKAVRKGGVGVVIKAGGERVRVVSDRRAVVAESKRLVAGRVNIILTVWWWSIGRVSVC